MKPEALTQSLKGPGTQFSVQGLTAWKPNHPDVLDLRARGHLPTQFGSRIWRSSYLLIDYLSKQSLRSNQHVLELGCGWGLPAAYVQKRFGSQVTATDSDANVFAYQQRISEINNAEVCAQHSSYADLCGQDLSGVDVLMGADICYSEEVAGSLEQLFHSFGDQGGGEVILADSGRATFFQLSDKLAGLYKLSLTDVALRLPAVADGHILHIRMPA